MKVKISLLGLFVFAFFAFEYGYAGQLSGSVNLAFNHRIMQDSSKVQKKVVEKKVIEKKENIGFGPVKEIKLGPINEAMVKEGKNIFNSKCFACHRLDTKLVGPALTPIVKKTNAVFLMNYLLNTTEMQKKEPELKKLIKEYNGVVMPEQNLNEKQARAVLEYLRANIKGK